MYIVPVLHSNILTTEVMRPLCCFLSPEQWFLFRDAYMSRVDKTEDHVLKLFRGYQDQWNKYSESLEKSRAAGGPDVVKVQHYQ